MITITIVLIVSCLLIITMLANKQREMRTGRSVFKIGTSGTDHMLKRLWMASSDLCSHIHPSNTRQTIQRSVVEIEKYIMNIFHRLSHKFSVVGDVVTGRDIPRNRGSVSFFLKNIEDSKKQDSL